MPTDVPSDEVIAITIDSTHIFQMSPLGPFAAVAEIGAQTSPANEARCLKQSSHNHNQFTLNVYKAELATLTPHEVVQAEIRNRHRVQSESVHFPRSKKS